MGGLTKDWDQHVAEAEAVARRPGFQDLRDRIMLASCASPRTARGLPSRAGKNRRRGHRRFTARAFVRWRSRRWRTKEESQAPASRRELEEGEQAGAAPAKKTGCSRWSTFPDLPRDIPPGTAPAPDHGTVASPPRGCPRCVVRAVGEQGRFRRAPAGASPKRQPRAARGTRRARQELLAGRLRRWLAGLFGAPRAAGWRSRVKLP
jgi:hypothetical protein